MSAYNEYLTKVVNKNYENYQAWSEAHYDVCELLDRAMKAIMVERGLDADDWDNGGTEIFCNALDNADQTFKDGNSLGGEYSIVKFLECFDGSIDCLI